MVQSIVARRSIRRGEEILVSYNYSIAKAPQWYRDLYFQHLRLREGRSEAYIAGAAKRINKDSGRNIVVPPPPRESSRLAKAFLFFLFSALHRGNR